MRPPAGAGRTLLLGGIVLALAILSCRSGVPPRVAQWAASPVRWLLLPEERRELAQLRSEAELEVFVAAFWTRRRHGGDEIERAFAERVERADRLYGEPGRRGSLTDRGRAFVLLGPPHTLDRRRQAILGEALDEAGQDLRHPTRWIMVEEWVYDPVELPAPVRQIRASDEAIRLVFEVGEVVRLLQGGDVLLAVARALVVECDEKGDDPCSPS